MSEKGPIASVERSRHVGFTPDSGRMAATQLNDASGQFQKSANFIQSLRRRRLSSDNRRIMLTLETASSIGTAKAFANRQLYFALEYLNSPAGTVRT
jgi:hypothetical protein